MAVRWETAKYIMITSSIAGFDVHVKPAHGLGAAHCPLWNPSMSDYAEKKQTSQHPF
jgi:hypothetical protein